MYSNTNKSSTHFWLSSIILKLWVKKNYTKIDSIKINFHNPHNQTYIYTSVDIAKLVNNNFDVLDFNITIT
jgi:hypothetical protein